MSAALSADRNRPPDGLRISAAGKCPRRLTYAAAGRQPTNPPDEQGYNRMALGHAAEVLIVRSLQASGWETRHTCIDDGQLTLTLRHLDINPPVTGHPDGICRHPQLTNGVWVTLECKSMSDAAGDRVDLAGDIFAHYPDYKAQIALYTAELHRQRLVPHRNKGVFAMMSREGRVLPVQRLTWEPDYADRMEAKLQQVHRWAQTGQLPERPHAADSHECGYCPYRNLCWQTEAQAPPFDRREQPTQLPDPAVREAAAAWLKGRRLTDQHKPALEEALRQNDGYPIQAEGVTASYFTPQDQVRYDTSRLARFLSRDQLEACRLAPPQQRIWIRPARK